MQFNAESTDEILIKGCLKKNRQAQKCLYMKYFSSMMKICYRYTTDENQAQEVLNDAFFKVFTSIEKYNATGPLEAWMAKIVFHTSIDHVRKNTVYKRTIELDELPEIQINEDAISNLGKDELMSLIENLAPSSRNVFMMYTIDGYQHKEIAELLSISIGTSKWHLANARKELQMMLKKIGEYPLAI